MIHNVPTVLFVTLILTATLMANFMVLLSAKTTTRASIGALAPNLTLAGILILNSMYPAVEAADRRVYTIDLGVIQRLGITNSFGIADMPSDPMFVLFLRLVSFVGTTPAILYLFVSLVCCLLTLGTLVKLGSASAMALTWTVTLGLGFFSSYAGLVARQAISLSLIFCAVGFFLVRGLRVSSGVLLAAAALFHLSAIPIAVMALVLMRWRISLKIAVSVWLIGATLLVTGLNSILAPVVGVIPEFGRYQSSALADAYTGGVNRLDFLAFSLLVGLYGLLALRFSRTCPPWYDRLLVMYISFNIYFLFFGFIYYSDRLASYSWSLAPLLIAAPLTTGSASARTRVASVILYLVFVAALCFGGIVGDFYGLLGRVL